MTVKENFEKVAYTAVGAPVAGVRAIKEKAGDLAETVKQKRGDLRTDAQHEFEQWIAEGEAVVDRMVEWLRSTGVTTQMRSARQSAVEQVRSGFLDLSGRLEQALDVVEPDIELTEVRGIGPATAKKLASVGVTGIASLLAETSTEAGLARLADKSEIAAGTLAGWRKEADLTAIDGVGDAYQRALHALGVGTLTHLANAEAKDLAQKMSTLDRPGLPAQDPGRATISKWIREARRLSLDDRK